MIPSSARLFGAGLGCFRGGRDVFCGLQFKVRAGEILLLRGPNGSGKSSLLRMIAGLLTPHEGALTFEGGDPELRVGEQAHYLAHQDPLKPALTVLENLEFWASYLGGPDMTCGDALAAVGLEDLAALPAGYLSAGQRRRLSIARLLVTHRPIWLLDEPTAALDAEGQARLTTAMGAHLGRGGLIVAATHDPLDFPQARILTLGAPAPAEASS